MTDNITPQVPQTQAPMTTEEVIQRLGRLKACCILKVPGNVTAQDTQALTVAIQAVELLEKIKRELQGVCRACKYHELLNTQEPCRNCSTGNDLWEFRWPLGEEEADR